MRKILKLLDKPESLIKFVADRKGHDLRFAVNPYKIKNELGWKPKYNFETGIIQFVNWYIENNQWVQNIISSEYQRFLNS